MPSIRVEHSDGSTDTLEHLRHRIEYEFGKQDQASLYTSRSEVSGVTLTEREDEVYLDVSGTDEFGGQLRDVVRDGPEIELVVNSFEEFAREAKPTSGDDEYTDADDSTIISDAVSDTPNLSAGTINTIKSGISFVFSHSTQALKIRDTEEITSGEVRYNADKTVDYVDSLGSNKTGTVLSPSNQNIVDDPKVQRHGGDEQVTHLRVIGSGEGEHQITAETIVSDYDGGREVWAVESNKSLTDEDALQAYADTLIDEMTDEHIEVEMVVKGPTVELGDEFHVNVPKENVDRNLRVVESTWVWDSKGSRYSVVLSSRQKTRDDPETNQKKDVGRYNSAMEGVAVPINAGGGRSPVSPGNPYVMKLYYPAETVFEHRLNLRVMGLPYRAYSSGAAASSAGSDNVSPLDVGFSSGSITESMSYPDAGE
jgi:hypothetical protein